MLDKIYGGIIGLCIGDALGVPVEFMNRNELKKSPVTDMIEYGTHNQPKGTWSDDSSMTLCLADSISECGEINYIDIMNRFQSWANKGKYTAHDEVFDMGISTRKALTNYANGILPLECGGKSEYDNGNGALMRILPMAYYIKYTYGDSYNQNIKAIKMVHNVCSLTHGHIRSQIACGIYVAVAVSFLQGFTSKENVKTAIKNIIMFYEKNKIYKREMIYFCRIKNIDNLCKLPEEEIQSSGYVIHTLEASLWCLMNTNSYSECVLKAVNLGDDTDTTGAVVGGLAGLMYGYNHIPKEWIKILGKKDWIENICLELDNTMFTNAVKPLLKYIPYFEKARERHSSDDLINVNSDIKERQSFKYDKMLIDFIQEVYDSNLMDLNYNMTIAEETRESENWDEIVENISLANRRLTMAILTAIVRGERFNDGLWAKALQREWFLKILSRLNFLMDL